MSGIGAVITRDDASPLLARVKDAAQVAGLSLVMARAIGIQVKDHLIALNAERHRYGRNYYARAARSVSTRGAGGFALVSITQIGFRQRFHGGRIVPGAGKKFLTIPAAPEAYGKRAGEFSDLKLGRALNEHGRLQWALIRKVSTPRSVIHRMDGTGRIKRTTPGQFKAGGEVIFWLARSVTQRADPSVLPTKQEMIATGIAAAERRLQRLNDRAAQ